MTEEQRRQLQQQLWNIANTLRGKMNADEFRDYILGFIFYKYLSEKVERYADVLLAEDQLKFAELDEYTEDGAEIVQAVQDAAVKQLGYFLKPSELFHAVAMKGNNQLDAENLGDSHNFILADLARILKNIEQSTLGTDSADDFSNLFEDLDLTSSKLGATEKAKNALVAKVLVHLDKIDFNLADGTADVLGDAYEYLIGEFASGAGKKAGEFYTPQPVSTLLAKLVTSQNKNLKTLYDPTCGSGSLLLRVKREADEDGWLFSGRLLRVRLTNEKYNSKFLNQNFKNDAVKYRIRSAAVGQTMASLNTEILKNFQLNFPTSLSEQTKIANFLSAIDEKISQLTQKHDLLKQYKKGVMQQIFSQKLRFKDDDGQEFPEWEEKKLRDICLFFSGGTPLTTNKQFYDGEIPFIKSGEIGEISTTQFITANGLKKSSAKMVAVGDLLYALYGATSGTVAISKIEGAINQAVLCIRSTLNTYFLYSYLIFMKEAILETYLQGGQGNLSAEIIRSLDAPYPSEKEQTKIANFLTAIDDKITHTQTQFNAVKLYKKGLLQQLFV